MNIQQFSPDSSKELRHRFARKKKPTWQIAAEETAANAKAYLTTSFEKLGLKPSTKMSENERKSFFQQNARFYAVYLGLFLAIFTVVTIFSFWTLSFGGRQYAKVSDSYDHAIPKANLKAHFGANLIEIHPRWRKKIFSLRSNDVINHRFDQFVISILVQKEIAMNGLIQASLGTFLRQINRIQICSNKVANSFIGGDLHSFVPFQPESIIYPALERYIDGFRSMLIFSPKQDWFIQVDEDTYLFLENIYDSLKKYKPSTEALLIHNFALVSEPSAQDSQQGASKASHFPVSIMSRKAVEMLHASDYGACILKNKYLSQEAIMLKCVTDIGVEAVREQGLHQSEPSVDFSWPLDPCKQPLAVSQLSPQQLQFLYNSKPSQGVGALDGQAYKWDAPMTYSELFHHAFGSEGSKPKAGISRSSGADETVATKSGSECLALCKSRRDCLSWTFSETACHLATTFGTESKSSNSVSGLIGSRYTCATS